MTKILVAGLINIETTLRVEGFPIAYSPVRFPFFGVGSTVSGVGVNISKALRTLGDEVQFLSIVGRDLGGELALAELAHAGLDTSDILRLAVQTAQSVILYEPGGRRQVNVDLKDIQETAYPAQRFEQALTGSALAVLCNINFTRPFLRAAQRAGAPVASDVHAIHDANDAYNADYLRAANILFMSHENLPEPPEDWARRLQGQYGNEIIVIGLGAQGALLAVKRDRFVGRFPARITRAVVNTIGAGDALFSCFVHHYTQNGDPYAALQRAIYFASWKIGEAGAADGFLTADEVERGLAAAVHASPVSEFAENGG